MPHQFALPIRLKPQPVSPGPESRTSRANSNSNASPACGLRRAPILPRPRSGPHGRVVNRHRIGRENAKPEKTQDDVASATPADVDPFKSTPWTENPLPFLHNSMVFPSEGSLLNTPSPEPPAELLAEHADLLKLVGEHFRLDSSESPSPEPQITRVRSTSSYLSKGIRSTRIQSPVTGEPVHKLSLSNLSQFGRSNNRSSDFRSTSTSAKSRSTSAASSTQEAIADAAAVINQWQGERKPIESYHRYELNSSGEESSSEQGSFNSDKLYSNSSSNDTKPPRYSEIIEMKNQYDGVGDAPQSHPESPLPSAYQRKWPQGAKRKASQFSLRSLTKPLAKRPRLAIKRIASNAYRGGSRQFCRARELMKRQREEELKQYAAWKAMRRRSKPGDALKGKFEKGFGTFSIERSRYGHEMWWKDGVEKYHAPKWLQFDASGMRK
ncbi:hypothetical protein QQX98_008354 [Neonectria punicea]|uniref:Uncharacterized protein n=1 Tax=Neonectria punicea TaxID=979145 RepID=A0ABR1GV86_9HYPO